jgi:hypothetical protein
VYQPAFGVEVLDSCGGDIFQVDLISLFRVQLKNLSPTKRLPYICNADPAMIF